MTVTFEISDDIFNKFLLAIQLNNNDKDIVVEELLSEYASNSFSKAAKSLSIKKDNNNNDYIDNVDFGKAIRKIPGWAFKANQNNHKLIKAYLLLQEEQGIVSFEELVHRCTDVTNYPDTFVNDFRGNFAQMKTDTGNSHGKVFVVENGEVKIWSEVQPIIDEYAERFKGNGTMTLLDIIEHQDDDKNDRLIITHEMTQEAYKVSKEVYFGKISRSKGKMRISENTGMAEGSAQDYITDFLAMMAGERYTRTLNLYATEYFLNSIKTDFGEKAFINAITACQKHVDYYNRLGYGKQVKTQELINRLRDKELG